MNNINKGQGFTHPSLVTITVQIPHGSEQAFTKVVEAWCDALTGTTSLPITDSSTSHTQLLSAATQWWKTLNANERAIWNLWIDSAPELVPASRIVNELNLKSTKSIKGVINRMAPKGQRVGFQVGWQSDKIDPLTNEKLYGVRDFGTGAFAYDQITLTAGEYADLLRQARTAAESI